MDGADSACGRRQLDQSRAVEIHDEHFAVAIAILPRDQVARRRKRDLLNQTIEGGIARSISDAAAGVRELNEADLRLRRRSLRDWQCESYRGETNQKPASGTKGTKDTRVGEVVAHEEFSRGISFTEPVDWSELQTALGGEA